MTIFLLSFMSLFSFAAQSVQPSILKKANCSFGTSKLELEAVSETGQEFEDDSVINMNIRGAKIVTPFSKSSFWELLPPKEFPACDRIIGILVDRHRSLLLFGVDSRPGLNMLAALLFDPSTGKILDSRKNLGAYTKSIKFDKTASGFRVHLAQGWNKSPTSDSIQEVSMGWMSLKVRGSRISAHWEKPLPHTHAPYSYPDVLPFEASLVTNYKSLEMLPKEPGEYLKIKKLTVEASCVRPTPLKALPDWVESLELLEELNLGTDKEVADRQECDLVVTLPTDLSKLKKLKKFVADNAFGSQNPGPLESLKMPTTLEILSLNRVGLKRIPEWVFHQKNLRRLTLQYGAISEVPQKISTLKSLEELNLLSNSIQELPPELISLPKLKKLWLGNNKLSKLQQSQIKKQFPKVEISFTNMWDDNRANEE